MGPSGANSDPQVLIYAQPPSRRVQRLLFRGFVLLSILFAVAGWHWRDVLSKRGTLMYWQHQCLNYAPSEGTPIYERAAPLQNHLEFLGNVDRTLPAASGTVPNCWTQFDVVAGPFLTPSRSTLNRVPSAIAFLHERRSPSGKSFLVCVAIYSGWNTPVVGGRAAVGVDVIAAIAIDPASLTGVPIVRQRPAMGSIRHFGGDPRQLSKQVFAGQPDPADLSHFTIRYKAGRVTDVLDGMVDDHGNVTLTPRNPPRADREAPLLIY